MARRSNMTQQKRQRELHKAEKAARKRAKRRELAKERSPDAEVVTPDEDADDSGLVETEPVRQDDCSALSPPPRSISSPPEVSIMEADHEPVEDVIAYCKVCKRPVGHEIIEMNGKTPKRVRCRTCRDTHPYRAKRPSPKKRVVGVESSYDVLVKRRASSPAKRYELGTRFADSDLIEHETFGVGLVTRVLVDSKIEVLFASGTKILAHNR